MEFAHLHVHTHYSILDAHSLIPDLFERAEELQMPAIAITDHGNMYGVKEFFNCAKKHRIKVVATNDVHFVKAEDAPLHDRLLCLETNTYVDDSWRRRYTQQEYLKTEEEMLSLFPEHPEVLANTMDVVNKVEAYSLDRDIELPVYQPDDVFERDLEQYLKKHKDIIKEGASAPIGDEKD